MPTAREWLVQNQPKFPDRESLIVAAMDALDVHRDTVVKALRKVSVETGTRTKTEEEFQEVDYSGAQFEPALFLKLIQDNGRITSLDLCRELDCSPDRIDELIRYHRSRGMALMERNGEIFFSDLPIDGEPIELMGNQSVIFGIASDLHFGSTACQITALKTFCDICKKRGVEHIVVPGDVFAGVGVYRGQEYDLYANSAEGQKASAEKNLPTGFNWLMLGGNHDYSFFSRNGHNILKALEMSRDDVTYLGFDEATIPLLPNVDMIAWHPSGGVPYAASYRLQKGVEQSAYGELAAIVYGGKEKPTLRFVIAGHLHIQLQAMFGPIMGIQAGCFEGCTNYLRRKKLTPAIGGYIIEADLDKRGRLRNHDARFYHFEEIENDWENYNHKGDCINPVEPLFK